MLYYLTDTIQGCCITWYRPSACFSTQCIGMRTTVELSPCPT
jgi:hypothetical protein